MMEGDNQHHKWVGNGQNGEPRMDYHRKQGNTSSVTPHYKGRVVHTQELQQEWNRCPLDDVKWIKDDAACVGERHSKNDEENSVWFLVSVAMFI